MTSYFAADVPVPLGLQTERLLLEPLRPEHVELDYEAVMESRDYLRRWSGSTWPADDFSLQENLDDLRWHWREHQERAAFTYTVLDPARESCLGCVYLRPLSELKPANEDLLQNVAKDESLVRCWIRTSQRDGDLEDHLLQSLIDWLRADWPFARVFFETHQQNGAQNRLFEKMLRPTMTLLMPERGGYHIFYLV